MIVIINPPAAGSCRPLKGGPRKNKHRLSDLDVTFRRWFLVGPPPFSDPPLGDSDGQTGFSQKGHKTPYMLPHVALSAHLFRGEIIEYIYFSGLGVRMVWKMLKKALPLRQAVRQDLERQL